VAGGATRQTPTQIFQMVKVHLGLYGNLPSRCWTPQW